MPTRRTFQNRKIRIGPRGGKYILKGGRKMYLSGGQACSKYRKTKDPKCEEQDGCQWVKGKGCTGSKTKPGKKTSAKAPSPSESGRKRSAKKSGKKAKKSQGEYTMAEKAAAKQFVSRIFEYLLKGEASLSEIRKYLNVSKKESRFIEVVLAKGNVMAGNLNVFVKHKGKYKVNPKALLNMVI